MRGSSFRRFVPSRNALLLIGFLVAAVFGGGADTPWAV